MSIFKLMLVILSLIVAVTATILAIRAQRKWRELNPRDKKTGERRKNKKKDYLRFQARAYLTTAMCALITVFKPEIAWVLIMTGCVAFVGPMWYQYSRVGRQARQLKGAKNKKTGEPYGQYIKWKMRRYTWVVPTTTLVASFCICGLGVIWMRLPTVSCVWWLALVFSYLTIMTMMILQRWVTTRPKKKSWKWIPGAAIGLVLMASIATMTIIALPTSINASDQLPPPEDEQTTSATEKSEKKACNVDLSANIPNRAHDAEYAFEVSTEALFWAATQTGVLPDGVKAHGDLQGDETGCPSKEGEQAYDDLLATTTNAELDELWTRFCDEHDCPTNPDGSND